LNSDNDPPLIKPRRSTYRKVDKQPAKLENEDLIANEDEIKDYKYLISCQICLELVILSKDP
jgi:hypothetical protein